MKCRKPFYGIHACGQCLPCRINKRREWQLRILLESMIHKENAFITLTYEKDPYTLLPSDLKLFLRRYKNRENIRFFAVGEYGDQSQRPHYHVAIFGHHPSTEWLEKLWGKGICHVGDLNPQSASYVAGYVTKKLTNKHDFNVQLWLQGRHPEFMRYSPRPAIGVNAIRQIADKTSEFVIDQQTIMLGSKRAPLGRTLKRKLKELTLNPETIHEMQMQRQEEKFIAEKTSFETFSHSSLSWSEFQKKKQEQLLLNDEQKLRLKPCKKRTL